MKLAERIEDIIFSVPSAVIHTIWFVIWFKRHLDINLLTLIVSLEAIYLTIFVGLATKHTEDHLHEHLDKQNKQELKK